MRGGSDTLQDEFASTSSMDQQKFHPLVFWEEAIIEDSDEETGFFHLPPEIRLQIWQLALPQGRVLIITFKDDNEKEHAHSMGPTTMPTILHVCHESRKFAKTVLRLGFGTTSTAIDVDWWNPNRDILFLPPWVPPPNWDLRVSFNFQDFQENFTYPPQDMQRDDSTIGSAAHHNSLAAVKHLALPFNFNVLNGIKFSQRSESWLPPWLHGFPNLKSVKLLIDHVPQWYRAGDIQLYLPLDVPLNGPPLPTASLTFNTPSRIETKMTQRLEEFRRQSDPEWELPIVEIMVMGITERKEQCGFCLPIRSG
jgi:hypothetical protein